MLQTVQNFIFKKIKTSDADGNKASKGQKLNMLAISFTCIAWYFNKPA